MRKPTALLLAGCLVATLFLAGCSAGKRQEEPAANTLGIACIYISHADIYIARPQYKVDFADQKVWVFMVRSNEDTRTRDETAKNEGYYFLKDLKAEDIEIFCEASREYGLEEWKASYEQTDIYTTCGHAWGVRICYADGTEKSVSGYETYPETWEQMDEAFESLTGTRVLSGPPPAPTFWFFGRPVFW